jgi:glutamine synthetase
MECPEPLNEINVYDLGSDEREARGISELPGSLSEALAELEGDATLRDALGPDLYDTFTRAKSAEVEEYGSMVSDWEVTRYLETA